VSEQAQQLAPEGGAHRLLHAVQEFHDVRPPAGLPGVLKGIAQTIHATQRVVIPRRRPFAHDVISFAQMRRMRSNLRSTVASERPSPPFNLGAISSLV
jgi:hypothetical protein